MRGEITGKAHSVKGVSRFGIIDPVKIRYPLPLHSEVDIDDRIISEGILYILDCIGEGFNALKEFVQGKRGNERTVVYCASILKLYNFLLYIDGLSFFRQLWLCS